MSFEVDSILQAEYISNKKVICKMIGTIVKVVPAGQALSDSDMSEYTELKHSDREYSRVQDACALRRVILQSGEKHYIVPLNYDHWRFKKQVKP